MGRLVVARGQGMEVIANSDEISLFNVFELDSGDNCLYDIPFPCQVTYSVIQGLECGHP
jgi:hypothetical protein